MWSFENDTYKVFAKPVVVPLDGDRTAIITHYMPDNESPFKGFGLFNKSRYNTSWTERGVDTTVGPKNNIPEDKLPKIPVQPKVGELWHFVDKPYFFNYMPALVIDRGPIETLCVVCDPTHFSLGSQFIKNENFQTKTSLHYLTPAHRSALNVMHLATSAIKTLYATPISTEP